MAFVTTPKIKKEWKPTKLSIVIRNNNILGLFRSHKKAVEFIRKEKKFQEPFWVEDWYIDGGKDRRRSY